MSNNLLMDIKDGISQSERLFDTLIPDNFQVEAREIPDFLNFISELAEQITYYNFSNEPEGDWRDFFKSEDHILVVVVSRFDLTAQFRKFHNYITSVSSCDTDKELVALLKKIFDCIFDILESLSNLKNQFGKKEQAPEITNLLSLIQDIDFEIARLKRYNANAVAHFGKNVKAGSHLSVSAKDTGKADIFEIHTDDEKITVGIQRQPHSVKEKITAAIPDLTTLLNYTQARYNQLIKTAKSYLKQNTLLEKTYSPHISLLIAFLKLYQDHLRPAINGITKRHLDFYFKDLLGIASSKAKADRVHLLIEPEQGIINFYLDEVEKVIALKPGKPEPLLYQLEHPVYISKAKIEELKTVFVSDYTQIIAEDRERSDIREAQVYKINNPLFDAAAYQKKKLELSSWPILGEDQHNLAGSARTMENADIGLLICSPLFYQLEGERTINIKIHVHADDFKDFKSFVQNYSEVAGKPKETILHQLLFRAFVINYSSTEDWEEVSSYTLKLNEEVNGGNAFEIEFVLPPSAKPMDLYQPLIHGDGYASPYPVVKLLANNFSPLNPYSFLRNLLIERVSIKVEVKNFTGLRLHNNISTLSTANPFQPFGPQPGIGSFLDIKNSNVFNRYTKKICISIDWLDLPRDAGGFDAYYEGYSGPIKNESFKVGISAIAGNRFKPVGQSQQQYNLFETENYRQLKNKTTFDNIDLKKIEFPNAPVLAAEDDLSDAQFKEGVIRIELLSPAEGFGHRQFPKLFPEVVMNNAKMFKKKLPLPNQPYIPVIKTIAVDFTLEHSENFRDANNESQNSMLLIHQHPFGYHTIYPHNSKKNYYFMPQFNDDSNLYIGLSGVEANQEVSFLFQVEEKEFHHTVHEPDIIKWSYLVSNSWQELDTLSVLNDSTNNFVNSGIIRLKMPPEITTGNTILNPALFWLRAAVSESCGTQSRVIAVCTNASEAMRVADGFIESETDFNLPPGCITGFTRNVKGVQAVRQLFPSFGGRPHETQEKYYIRVSERLRHKYRPVQTRDMMQLILEEFPQILMVKCFGIGGQESLILPGVNVQVVLIPKELEDGRFISAQPKVDLATLFQVKTFIRKLISPFVRIEVGNAVYEKVKVVCSVVFNDTRISDHGFYIRQLNEDINRYISPWLFDSKSEIRIGGRLYKSDLFMMIKSLYYVSYVTGFSAVHFYNVKTGDTDAFDASIEDTAVDVVDFVTGSGPASVLIPSLNHIINVLEKPDYKSPKQTGINGFTIGEELLITDKYDFEAEHQPPAPKKPAPLETFNLIISHDIEN